MVYMMEGCIEIRLALTTMTGGCRTPDHPLVPRGAEPVRVRLLWLEWRQMR
jgi:hypothetical protein